MSYEDEERARARRDVQLGRKPGFLDSAAYQEEHRNAEASASLGAGALIAIPLVALGAAGMLAGLLQAVAAVVILGLMLLAIKFVGPRLPPAVRRAMLRLALVALAVLAILILYGLYQDHRRATARDALDARVAAMVDGIAQEPDLSSTAKRFTDQERRNFAIIQYNLRHMPTDPGQQGFGWHYGGAIDGDWRSMSRGIEDPLAFICNDRLKNKYGVPAGLTLSQDEACSQTFGLGPPKDVERLVVYTTELRHKLITKYCVPGMKDRWNNCPRI